MLPRTAKLQRSWLTVNKDNQHKMIVSHYLLLSKGEKFLIGKIPNNVGKLSSHTLILKLELFSPLV